MIRLRRCSSVYCAAPEPKACLGFRLPEPSALDNLFDRLLNWPKSQSADLCSTRAARWIEDESNQQQQFDRNYLRNTVVPELAQRWPDYVQGVMR